MNTEYGYDIITIFDHASETKEKILLVTSGDVPPENIISNNNEIRIVFKTDVNQPMAGFEASVTAVKKKGERNNFVQLRILPKISSG